MDPEINGLWRLPKMVQFQYMSILAFMWSGIFTLWTGAISIFGPTVLGHAILLVGVFFTADLLRRVQRSAASHQFFHHRDAMRNRRDGTVLYDDIWGAP
jgi:hypothetical protein